MSGVIAGIDVGGTKIALAVARRDGTVLAEDRFATRAERGPDAVLDELLARLSDLIGRTDGDLEAIGVASAGPLDLAAGAMMSPPNFDGWGVVPLRAPLSRAFGVPIFVDNDANAAALAEYTQGAGRGSRVMVYVTVSTGVGAGIVIDGQVLHGLGGGAGEIGHQTIVPGGPLCKCGNRGCLEVMASGTAIAAQAQAAIAAGRGGAIAALAASEGVAPHAGIVARAAAMGDATAASIWDTAMDALATGLSNVVTILAPDRLVLGGGVCQVGARLLEPVIAGIARRVHLVPVADLDIRLAECVNDAGLQGALSLARRG